MDYGITVILITEQNFINGIGHNGLDLQLVILK